MRLIMEKLEIRYRKDPSIISREIAGEVILVPIRRNVGDLESIYTLNETGARAWALVDGEQTLGEICVQIMAEYEVSQVEVQKDLIELFDQLLTIGALVRV